MATVFHTTIKTRTPLGAIHMAASEKGMVQLGFRCSDMPAAFERTFADDTKWIESPENMKPYVRQMEEYLAGQRKKFDLDLDLHGTPFQKRCWNALLKIPYGKTCSYAELAQAVGSPDGFRAVGQANHRNPVAIIVPCHRVVTTEGTLGGYGGGLEAKRWLLELEGAELPCLATRQLTLLD